MAAPALEVGVDIIEVPRIARAVARWGNSFLRRVYTPAEIAYCRERIPELAVRFAAKEAVSKALGVGIWWRGGISWLDVEVTADRLGKPQVALSGRAAAYAREQRLDGWTISLSHTAEHAIAMVVATRNSG